MDEHDREQTTAPAPSVLPGTEQRLPLDTVFELLANRRRRFALYTLLDAADGVVPFDALVEDVAALEAGVAGEAFTRDRYVDAATDLHYWHLQVLADSGLAEYDEQSGTVRYRSHPGLETWLCRARRDELRRSSGRL